MYPTSKYSTRTPSPTFVNFSPPSDYPSTHQHSMTMKHMMSKGQSSATLGGRHELMFPEDVDSIEFCVRDNNNINLGCPGDSFSERRRRGHSRRSNHKLEVEQQVKWTRKNIAATMERFEPTNKIDYSPTSATASGLTIGTPAAVGAATASSAVMQQPPINHVYSYAYYEPGAAKCHTNIPQKEASINPMPGPSKSPPRNSIRALLAKSFRSKAINNSNMTAGGAGVGSLTAEERHTYTTRYGTQENLYEEVNEQKIRKVLSDNRIVSVNSSIVKEELRRVQHNHFRVLDELNLSLEALIMPPTPPDISPTATTMEEKTTSHLSMENLSSTLNSIELKDHTCINPEFDEGDLDSGFSGSGSSSGASYNESLRYYKTGAVMQATTLPHMRSCRSSTSNTSTSKSSMNSDQDQGICGGGSGSGLMATTSTTSSPFNYARRCSDSQRSSTSSSGCGGGGGGGCGTKPKKNFWTIKQ